MHKDELIFQKLDNPELIKVAKTLKNEGKVLQDKNYAYLKISDDFIHKLYPLIAEHENLQKPDYFSEQCNIGAHITITYPNEEVVIKEFELKSIVVNFLRNSLGKEYTSSQIATWIFDNYPAEMERKIQESNNKRLLKARSNTLKRKIVIMIYRNEFNKEFRAAIQKMDSKIKIIKKGTLFKYYYINNADRIIDCDNILYNEFDSIDAAIKFLKTNAGREFTNSQIATWLV
ncbi:MAG TPA: hypothetical protein LFV90_05685 [Rickettsia endosymbiont of Columbicola hoogstraali]|nr:hypothetical protein [Rickettsia endosymbiont of Columbicola hoogstraali]